MLPWTYRIEGERVALRAPRMKDAARLVKLRRDSWDFLAPWLPAPVSGVDLRVETEGKIARERLEWRDDRGYSFCIELRATREIIGRVSINSLVRGSFQNVYLGYWVGAPFVRQGLTTEAVRLALDVAFGPLQLHRVQAAIIPRNTASLALARKIGMREEGLAKRYLRIAGEWQDHVLFALTSDEWPIQR